MGPTALTDSGAVWWARTLAEKAWDGRQPHRLLHEGQLTQASASLRPTGLEPREWVEVVAGPLAGCTAQVTHTPPPGQGEAEAGWSGWLGVRTASGTTCEVQRVHIDATRARISKDLKAGAIAALHVSAD